MREKGFIFTMDAMLALIPLFVVLASVSSVSYSESLFTRSFMIGGGRIANDVLRVLDIKGDLNETNSTRINATLQSFIPSDYNFRFRLLLNASNESTVLANASRGNLSNATNIAAAARVTKIKIYSVLTNMLGVSQFGSKTATPCCSSGSGDASKKVYKGSFYVNNSDKKLYTFWLLGEKQSGTATAPVEIGIRPYSNATTCECTGDFVEIPELTAPLDFKQDITNYITEGTTNEIFVCVSGNQVGNFWVIRAPLNPVQAEITPENAQFYTSVLAKLEVWPK